MKTAALLVLVIQAAFLTAVAGALLYLFGLVTVAQVIGAVILLPAIVGTGFLLIVPSVR